MKLAAIILYNKVYFWRSNGSIIIVIYQTMSGISRKRADLVNIVIAAVRRKVEATF